jgi:hypothetical protein
VRATGDRPALQSRATVRRGSDSAGLSFVW